MKFLTKIKLKNKILLLFITFTIVILSAVIFYFNTAGKQFLQSQAEISNQKNIKRFEIIFNEILDESYKELKGLESQLRSVGLTEASPESLNSPIFLSFKRFLSGYKFKYTELFLSNSNWKNILSAFPVKVFSGELETVFTYKNPEDIDEILKDNLSVKESSRKETLISVINSKKQVLLLLSDFTGLPELKLSAILDFNYVVEQILARMKLTEDTDLILSNAEGIIFFTSELKYLNNHLSSLINDINADAFYDLGTEEPFQIEGEYNNLMTDYLRDLNIFISMRENFEINILEFNKIVRNALIFAAVLFSIVFVLVRLLSNKLSVSLQTLTDVASDISKGDFSRKIEIKRNDELGILIDTFNEMIERLRQSYSSLNEVNLELEKKIDELIKTKTELSNSQRLAIIGETISKISHEIQNKIGAVSIWIQNLEIHTRDNISLNYIGEMKNALEFLP